MPKHQYTHASGYDYNTCLTYKDANKLLKYHFGDDWHWKIDLDSLDMYSGDQCILGQLSIEGYGFIDTLRGANTSPLSHPLKYSHPFGDFTTINWNHKILKRREKFPHLGDYTDTGISKNHKKIRI